MYKIKKRNYQYIKFYFSFAPKNNKNRNKKHKQTKKKAQKKEKLFACNIVSYIQHKKF